MSKICQEVECVFCGKPFKQARWWQRACSDECRIKVNNNRTSELHELTKEVVDLRKRLKRAEDDAERYYRDSVELAKLKRQMQTGYVAQWED